MTTVHTETLGPGSLGPNQTLQTYCGLDCCVTLEVREELGLQWPNPPAIYQFERALQGPYLEMMQRGFLVDEIARRQAAELLRGRIGILQSNLNSMATAVWDRGLNPASPLQLRAFFYQSMGLPEVWIRQKGERKLSTNREALEKLEAYLYARPIIASILAIRDLSKQLQVFDTEIDRDGRFRTSYNIAGTETGRPSSSTNAFGTGGNAQNIAKGLRFVFVADPGYKLCNIDLEQVEARDVGYIIGCLFGDWTYLNACESGDLHTNNCKLVWPEKPWTGKPRLDRAIADGRFYREFTYRDMAKRGGHLSNYGGTPWTMARSLKVPLPVAEDFQLRYCTGSQAAYPGIPRWWNWVATELQTKSSLTTPFGRKRHFFGRPGDDTTLREAIAFMPQSTTADRMNLGLWRVWRYMPECQLLAQTYDSITFQFREELDEAQVIGRALELIRVVLRRPSGSPYVVPGEAKVGCNWGDRHSDTQPIGPGNRCTPEGLVKWAPGVDKRIRATGLERVMQ